MSRFMQVYEPVQELFGLFKSKQEHLFRAIIPKYKQTEYCYGTKYDAVIMAILINTGNKLMTHKELIKIADQASIEVHDKNKCKKG